MDTSLFKHANNDYFEYIETTQQAQHLLDVSEWENHSSYTMKGCTKELGLFTFSHLLICQF